ncbi:E3 ubiquitin/ISG15 ligase TRIM25-like [Leuresthes tenuis]|uniref:E3 ubiquitin/ISG15 ligase TRIM25-like n=1 Tax=Leuresthes tenuis TaxID=355514 RepID=UPI003B512A1B
MMADAVEPGFSLMSLEDELTCSICLSTFDCPVTIPCGHNFCQDCLLTSWKDSYSCPQCRTVFATKPELKKNTVLSTVVETFNLRSSRSEAGLQGEESQPEEKDVIRCDACMEAEASQTCLTCMASYCEEHLRPHRENPVFRLHQLTELVDLMELICPDHHKLMELFCIQHERPICSLCLQQVHKGCSFMSPEEQRSLKESDFREKLALVVGKIERTDAVVQQMNELQSKLKDAANSRKTALAAVYQQMRDMLAQDERAAQHEVDCELEMGQTKLRDFTRRFNENSDRMKKAREDINSLLSQSQTLAFLQASFELPKVVKFDPHPPRTNLDSKKVTAAQSFAAVLRENLTEILALPFEARVPLLKAEPNAGSAPDDEKEASTSGPESAARRPESLKPAEQNPRSRSKSPGRPPIQPLFQTVPVPYYIQSQPPWMFQGSQGQSPGFPRGPPSFRGQTPQPRRDATNKTSSGQKEKKTVCKPAHKAMPNKAGDKSHKPKNEDRKSDSGHHPPHKQDRRPQSAAGGQKPAAKGPNSAHKEHPKSHPSSQKPAGHHPKKNK